MADCFEIRERTTLSPTDNMAGIWCQRKGLDTSTVSPHHLLHLQSIHKWFLRHVPRRDFLSRVDNGIFEHPYRSQDLTDVALLAYINASHTQELPWRIWNPPIELVSEISSTLLHTTLPRKSLLVDLLPPMGTGQSGPTYVDMWPLNSDSYCT